MPPYVFAPSQTSPSSFTALFTDPSPTRIYAPHLANATLHRSKLTEALRNYQAVKGDGELLSIAESAQDYLPHLYGLIGSLDQDEILTQSELGKSSIKANGFFKAHRY